MSAVAIIAQAGTDPSGWLPLIGGLGSSAAAVAVLWICARLILTMWSGLQELAKDEGEVIKANTEALGLMKDSMVEKLDQLHSALNSRLTELVEAARAAGHAAGMADERADQAIRRSTRTKRN